MPLLFANPAGLWALFGIPLVLLIHFLQRQSQTLPSSTLFLLDAIDRESVQGSKIDRIRNSLPLWLQLLSVLILTWLLLEPRWQRESGVQRIVIVLDSSASMEAFRDDVINSLNSELPAIITSHGNVSLTAIESHEQGENLYRGDSVQKLTATLANWEPSDSAHSPEAGLQIGRSLAGTEGTLIFVTDHETELPYGASLLSLGSPIENVGFAGQRVEEREDETVWQVTVMNHGKTTQTRDWFLAAGQQRTSPRSLTLQPGEVRTLAGKFPDESGKVRLILEPDAFPRDDERFLLVPSKKPLLVAHSVEAGAEKFVTDIIDSLENAPLYGSTETDSDTPDLVFSTYNPLQPDDFATQAVVFLHQKSVPRDYFKGLIIASNHKLVRNLNWQGLIARRTPSIPAAPGDRVLLWQGERPLIILRLQLGRKQLLFNFDVAKSNATRLPAFVILIHRFADLLREEKIARFAENLDLGQALSLAYGTEEGSPPLTLTEGQTSTTLPLNRTQHLYAPREPAFFNIRQGEFVLFEGSANFADTREADFSTASTYSDLGAIPEKVIETRTVNDPWWPAWILLLLILSLLCWAALSNPKSKEAEFSTMAP
ncbi:MAG: BatA domain-containing protein [Verrucomicrobiales bacterium]|nr:BatA domain-containing protein [Verrucomicrobiales bacterium]